MICSVRPVVWFVEPGLHALGDAIAAGNFTRGTPGTKVTSGEAFISAMSDGQSVGFVDLLRLAQNYDLSGREWSQGDFNFDGSANFTDLLFVAQNYEASVIRSRTASGARYRDEARLVFT